MRGLMAGAALAVVATLTLIGQTDALLQTTETTQTAPVAAPTESATPDVSTPAAAEEEVQPDYDLPAPPGHVRPQDLCGGGTVPEWVDVQGYSAPGFNPNYITRHADSTVRIRWMDMDAMVDALAAEGYVFSQSTMDLGNAPSPDETAGYCTGTLIRRGNTPADAQRSDLVLTARHCFDTHFDEGGWTTPYVKDAAGRMTPLPPEVLAKLMVVQFNYQFGPDNAPPAPQTYRIAELLEYGGPQRPFSSPDARRRLDYAIIRIVDDEQRTLRTHRPAIVATTSPAVNEAAAIIQHPGGVPKKIDIGSIFGRSGPYISYSNIETIGGSSGAALRDRSGVVRGVHVRGGCRTPGLGNRATPIEAIRATSLIL